MYYSAVTTKYVVQVGPGDGDYLGIKPLLFGGGFFTCTKLFIALARTGARASASNQVSFKAALFSLVSLMSCIVSLLPSTEQ